MMFENDYLKKGLHQEEVRKRLLEEGFNELSTSRPKGIWPIIGGVIREPMFILLVICSVLYMALGDITEGLILASFVVVIMWIEFYQESKTERALEALRDLSSPRALVIRDGREIRIAGREVVRDDLLVLQEGDRVPADALVLQCTNLLADESLLTGESAAVRKREWDGSSKAYPPGGDDLPVVFSGSMIVQGNGLARVTACGMQTELGKIGKALEAVPREPTRLKAEIGKMVRLTAMVSIILCILVVVAYALSRGDWIKGFLAGITLAMAMLPEEFPVVMTVFLALGAWRISRRNVLTRKPAAIESLGSASVLCTDKTGTLTENRMAVTCLYNGRSVLETEKITQLPEDFHEVIEYGILASQTRPFDPMEKAIIGMGNLYLQQTEHLHFDKAMVREYPLSPELLAMSRVFNDETNDRYLIAAKGAPEAIFDLCHLKAEVIGHIGHTVRLFASKGMRVIAVARAVISRTAIPKIQHDFDFAFTGLIGLHDPVREGVAEAVADCHRAGIRVIMITGDYPETAVQIARQCGLKEPERCISGQDLARMSEDELDHEISEVQVFARVVPEQKLKIVNALKRNGETVAMTGDGINDAPALKAAHIGIAMGDKGTDVAREASDLVLMDDNFLSIVNAIRMGRRIFDNLQKALSYIIAIHLPIAGISLIPVLAGKLPLILWPVHIVFLELIIDPACTLIFEAEKDEKDLMRRPPASPSRRFFGSQRLMISMIQGMNILAVVLAVYFAGLALDLSEEKTRAMTFSTLIIANLAVILSNRSRHDSIFRIITVKNNMVKWILSGALLFLLLTLELPFLRALFEFSSLTPTELAISALAGMLSVTWFEAYKWTGRKKAAMLR
ncbi:MAG TPA: cation-translocating P-type ATPase [Bacteroidales bacterium]|nr:cation-translocating P-type ATPase [Bacteroidales bacterium]HSA42489.1 cation-translocating P-type ATPase [Bacteroidales bacterium]